MSTEQLRRPIFSRLIRNWVSLLGAIIVAASWFAFLLLLVVDTTASLQNPYVGILTYLVAPAFFIIGLTIWLIGWLLYRRQLRRAAPGAAPTKFTFDIARPGDRRLLMVFALGGAGILLMTAVGSFGSYQATKSVTFCGQACHQPMEPQFMAYQHSPHARVGCTECHIGTGAGNFFKAKFNGLHQVFATLSKDFERPIRLSGNITINQETCEQCHWPQRHIGTLERSYTHYLTDETNSPFTVRLLLKVGGGNPSQGPVGGIHWHMNIANKVEYITTDKAEQVIPWVRLTDANGVVTTFADPDFKDDPSKHTVRRMDCLDCHNRPAHHFHPPNDLVDLALTGGQLDPSIPFVKSNVVAALVQPYTKKEEALAKIAEFLNTKYANHPKVGALVSEAQRLYQANFFPEMKVDWRAHPNNIGHKEWAGCFRCHDGKHVTADGKRTLKASDCNSCHTILAQGSGEQLNQLNPKGHTFFHIDAPNEDFSCNNCHTGAFPKE